jgi:O-antigen/teichoic acid export membrane protein
MLSSSMSSGLGLLYWFLAARFYAASDVGSNSAWLSAVLFLAGASGLGLGDVLIRFIPDAGQNASKLIRGSYLISLVPALAITASLTHMGDWLPSLNIPQQNSGWALAFLPLATMACAIFTLQDGVLTGLRQAEWVPVKNISFAVIKIILLIALSGSLRKSGILLSWVLTTGLLLAPAELVIFRKALPRFLAVGLGRDTGLRPRYVSRFALCNYPGILLSQISLRLLPILVTSQAGPTMNAYFYLPWIIASSVQEIAANLAASMTVEGSLIPSESSSHYRKSLKHSFRLLIPVVSGLFIFAPILLRAFGDAYAREGTTLLRLLLLATLPNSFVLHRLGLARVGNRAALILVIHLGGAALPLALSIWWLPMVGISGVGWATLAGKTIMALMLAKRSIDLDKASEDPKT